MKSLFTLIFIILVFFSSFLISQDVIKTDIVIFTYETSAPYTKIPAYAYQYLNCEVEVIYKNTHKFEEYLKGNCKGIIITEGANLTSITSLYDGIYNKGVRAVVLFTRLPNREDSIRLWRRYFNIAFAYENLIRDTTLFKKGGDYLPIWNDLEIGIRNSQYWNMFFLPKKTIFIEKFFKSSASNLDRTITAWRRLGKGEIVFIVTPNRGSSPWIPDWIGRDDNIDLLNNRRAYLELIKWLSGEREFH